MWSIESKRFTRNRRLGLKLHALKGGASRQGSFVYIVPLDPGLKAGDRGARSVQGLKHSPDTNNRISPFTQMAPKMEEIELGIPGITTKML